MLSEFISFIVAATSEQAVSCSSCSCSDGELYWAALGADRFSGDDVGNLLCSIEQMSKLNLTPFRCDLEFPYRRNLGSVAKWRSTN